MSETARQVLAAAAVIGRSFDVDTVRAASGRGDEETVTALEELVRRGLVREGRYDYDFAHEQLRRLVADETGLARRRLLHGRVADALLAAGSSPTAPERSPATSASRGATRRRPPPTAAPPSTRARCSPTPRRSSTCARRWRSAIRSRPRCTPRSATCRRCRASTAPRWPPTRRPRRTRRRTASARSSTGSGRSATGAASGRSRPRTSRPRWPPRREPSRRGGRGSCADLSLSAHDGGDPARAAELAERARALAEQAGDPRALGQAHNLLGALATSGGAAADALEHLGRSLELAEATGDPGARVAALNNLALAHRARGELEPALELTRAALALCAAQGDRHREAALHNNLADLLHDGRPARGGDGGAQVRGGDLRGGRRGGRAAAGGVEARALVTAAASSRTPARIAGSASWP